MKLLLVPPVIFFHVIFFLWPTFPPDIDFVIFVSFFGVCRSEVCSVQAYVTYSYIFTFQLHIPAMVYWHRVRWTGRKEAQFSFRQ